MIRSTSLVCSAFAALLIVVRDEMIGGSLDKQQILVAHDRLEANPA